MSIQEIDSRNLDKDPFVVNNQIYILGSPIINAQTLDQLVYVLDQLGASQPIVIINPEANTIEGFDQKLSNLIQNNRQVQPLSVTSDDKYRFKDMTDEELREYAKQECSKGNSFDLETTFYTYQGLRVRAQRLYALEQLSRERDDLWAAHCADPSSAEGSERYAELVSKLIPEAQAAYELVVKQLQEWDEQCLQHAARQEAEKPAQTQQSSVSNTTTHTTTEVANVAAKPADKEPIIDSGIIAVNSETSTQKPWGPWLKPRYLKMPLSVARNLADSSGYAELRQQQHDVEFEGAVYSAVQVEYLLALGIPVYKDGLPVCYTETGKFKRVGRGKQPANNLAYWYPQPTSL